MTDCTLELEEELLSISSLSIEIDKNRTRLSNIKKDKINNVKKLNALKMATSELENRKAISAGLVLSAEERVAAVEEILSEYERQKDGLRQEVARMRERRLVLERELAELAKEKEAAELEIKAIVKEEGKTRKGGGKAAGGGSWTRISSTFLTKESFTRSRSKRLPLCT